MHDRRTNSVDQTDIRIDPKPLYAQIAEQFASRIQSGALRPGDKIKSSARLVAEHGVSQVTVRQALLNLSRQGLVVTKQGKGVFVAEPRVNISLGVSTSNGSDFDHIPIGSDLIEAPDRVADLLDISTGSHFIRPRRKRFRLGHAVGLDTFNLPYDIMQSVPPQAPSTGDPRTLLL